MVFVKKMNKQKKEKKLSPRELIICHARIQNPTWPKYRCYLQAYPKCKIKSAYTSSTILFDRPHVAKYIDEFKQKMIEKIEVDQQYVLKGLMRIVEFNPQCLLDKDGNPLPLHELDPEDAKVIESVSEFEFVKIREDGKPDKIIPYIKKYKTGNNVAAYELFGKYLKMWIEKKEIILPDDLPDRIFNINFVGPEKE